jgi:hypothetical protein
MKLPKVLSLETLGFIAVVAVFIVFGQSAGWRAAGILQLAFSVHVLCHRDIPAGWEGHEPAFRVRGVWAVLVGVVSLGLAESRRDSRRLHYLRGCGELGAGPGFRGY